MTARFFQITLLLIWAFSTAACAQSQQESGMDQVVQSVRAVLEAQQAAWNRGDIEHFMEGYERSDTTTFISGGDITRGWQTVLDRYRQRYNSREQMGTLSFSDLEIQPLGPGYALADGRWHLKRTSDEPGGRFTLIFKQTGQGWRIVHDTTTSQ